MTYYMLLLRRENIDFSSYSPEDMQKLMGEFDQWNARMTGNGRLIASGNLPAGKGKTFRAGALVADGPYSEIREAVTGFFLLRANDDSEAEALAAGCPFLPRGGSVELRPVPQLDIENTAREVIDELARARAIDSGKEA